MERQEHISVERKGSAKHAGPNSREYENDHFSQDGEMDGWGDNDYDKRDMLRLGKKQEFKRNFHTLSALGFVSVYMATWEFVLVSLSIGFTNGGFAGLFWCFITTVCCYATIVASLAEMESMAPTSGGQYHWVSEFSPPEYQKILSYASGWVSTLGWLASVASSVYICATQIQAIINVTRPDFAFTAWQITLIMLLVTAVTIVFNTWGTPFFPELEIGSLVGHTLGFFVVLIPLWVLCKTNSAEEVFTSITDQSGWDNMGMAYLTCQVYVSNKHP
jgi:amino acid transporter